MVARRSNRFDPNIDVDLLTSLEKAAAGYDPYDVELFSGYRPNPSRYNSQHGPRGEGAIDFNLIDRKTGRALPNIRDPKSAPAYQAFVNHWFKSLSPEQQKRARWGGYFSDIPDWMHVDFGGADKMAGGSWEGGFNDAQAKRYGVNVGGGLGAAQQQAVAMAQAGYSPEQIRKAFLSTIAGTEAPGYDTLYGGGTFQGYGQHPNAKIPIMSGPNKGDYSSAAGRYQFLKGTWDEQQKKLGLKDFSPANQDLAAWDLAATNYKAATGGGDLFEALQSGDAGRINAAASILAKTWTSLPGGIEQNGRYGTSTFADHYRRLLGMANTSPAGPVEAAGGGAGSDPSSDAESAPAEPAWKKLVADMSKAGGGIASGMAAGPVGRRGSSMPQAARVDEGEFPTIDPRQVEMQRQQLAQALLRLNSGKLVG